MQLDEFFDYKNRLMEELLTTEEIVKLINSDYSALDGSSKNLAYNQVFPCDYVSKTIQEGKTYVLFEVDVLEAQSKTFLSPVLYIWVFTHGSRLCLPEGGLRVDKLCSEICKKINGSKKYGLGELNLHSVKRHTPMSDFPGKVMTFYAKDFNRQYDPHKSIPSNRKV